MEIKQRVANMFKFFSMLSIIVSLLFMYAYGSDDHSVLVLEQGWLSDISKATIFYTGLIIFGVINIIFNWWIKMYKETRGYDDKSLLFKNEYHKAGMLVWFTSLMAAINIFISALILYIAFIKIDGISAEGRFIFIPVAGLLFLVLVVVVGAISALRKA